MVYRCGDLASGLEIQGMISEFKAVRTQRVNTNVVIKVKRTIEILYIFHNNQRVLKLLHLLLLSFLVSPLIPTHCRRRGLLLHLLTLNDTHTHTHSVGLLCIGDQPEAETST
jgi:hypothetical protein